MILRVDYEKKTGGRGNARNLLLGILFILLGLGVRLISWGKTGQALEAMAADLKSGVSVGESLSELAFSLLHGIF